jgi:hypothetical protein
MKTANFHLESGPENSKPIVRFVPQLAVTFLFFWALLSSSSSKDLLLCGGLYGELYERP